MSVKKQVLVIDDEPNVCAYLKDLLEYFNYEVTFAYSCRDAINYLKQRSFDCLLLDLYMKNETGEVVLRWLRSLDRHEPVIMMCSMPNYELRIELIFKGASELLGKPIQPTQLQQVLQKVMQPFVQSPVGGLRHPSEFPAYLARLSS